MGIGYQTTDRRVIDYDLWFEPETMLEFRGPRSGANLSSTVVCAGAAQTFGRFVRRPFPEQLSALLRRPVLNLGRSGAGPEFYLSRPKLMSFLENSDLAIIQVMSARSVTAGRLTARAHNNGLLSFNGGPLNGSVYLANEAYRLLRSTEGEEVFQEQVNAAQARWLELHEELANSIPSRKLLLWISSKMPGENVDLSKSPVGEFPHFVTAEMMKQVEDMGFEIVKIVLEDMKPQVLVNDRTGVVEGVFNERNFPKRPDRIRALNTYYAVPELHDMAAREIFKHLIPKA